MMIIKYQLSVLKGRAERNPEGRAARLLARGKIVDDFVVLDEAVHREIMAKSTRRLPARYKIDKLQLPDRLRPHGFANFILARGKIEGDTVVLDTAAYKELQLLFYPPPPPPPPDPTLTELAGNFSLALASWSKAGFKIVAREEYERRHAVCVSCVHWTANARLGLGKCKKCGCTRMKLWLATSNCPDKPPRW